MQVENLIVWFLVAVKGRRIVSNAILHQIYIHEELGPLLENSSFLFGCAMFYEYFWNQNEEKQSKSIYDEKINYISKLISGEIQIETLRQSVGMD